MEKVPAPLQNARPTAGLTAQAEPLLQDFRRALVALAPAKSGAQALRRTCATSSSWKCDTSAVSNAARLIRSAPDSVVRTNARRDCRSAPTNDGEYLLAARDLTRSRRGPGRSTARRWTPASGRVLKEDHFTTDV